VFSLKLTARPDARMVEVPLEIEAELPREFEGAALLASSGLPRRVRIKQAKDALKLSTAYRADQLVADIVRSAFRGTASDIHRVQDAVMKFVRAVRERRQDGATLLVSSNGRGKIDVVEVMASARAQPPPVLAQPHETPRPPVAPDRVALLERRVADLESALARFSSGGDLVERIAQLEQKLAPAMAQISRTLATPEIAGPGLENHAAQGTSRGGSNARRGTAIEAYCEGLRGDLRARASAAAAKARADMERCDRAAALAVDAELLGAPRDGTAQRLRGVSTQAAARESALERLAEEIEFYGGADLPVAGQLLSRLDDTANQDSGPSLEPVAQAIVTAARGEDGHERTTWLQRAAALYGWQLVTPARGDPLDAEWHEAIDGGSDKVAGVAAPGLKRADGSRIARARVTVRSLPIAQENIPVPQETMRFAEPPAPVGFSEAPGAVAALAAAVAGSPAPPVALAIGAAASEAPLALLPPPSANSFLALAGLAEETPVHPEEAAAAAVAAARALRIVTEDPAMNDEALAAEVALAAAPPPGMDGVLHTDLGDPEPTG
jgi:hypothetical protein